MKKVLKRVLEIEEEDYYILQRAVDFLTSSSISIKPTNISLKDLYALDDRLTSTKFKDLPKVSEYIKS